METLSIGLELETWLPNVSGLVSDRLWPVREAEDLFELVADVVSEKVAAMGDQMTAKSRLVSAEQLDWGRLWTASLDASIAPTPRPLSKCDASPFPVELVSNVMRFDETNVNNFCDVCAALRSPPLRAQTNESTGLHVHVGRRFSSEGFLTIDELADVIAAYCRFESLINERVLPLLRRRSSYARDLRDGIAAAAGLVRKPNNEIQFTDSVVDFVYAASDRIKTQNLRKIQLPCVATAAALRKFLVGDLDGGFARVGNHRHQDSKPLFLKVRVSRKTEEYVMPPGMVLVLLSFKGELLWHHKRSSSPENRSKFASCWEALDSVLESEASEKNAWCAFQAAEGVNAMDEGDDGAFRRFLLRDALLPSGRAGYQTLLSGAESSLSSPNKYFKLNIGRLALPAKQATLEFRQFAGKDLDQTLVIFGWVRFCATFVTRASRGHYDHANIKGRPATERDLFHFLDIQNDPMLLCWWRDVANSVSDPKTEILRVKTHFTSLFDDWLKKSRVADALDPQFFQQDNDPHRRRNGYDDKEEEEDNTREENNNPRRQRRRRAVMGGDDDELLLPYSYRQELLVSGDDDNMSSYGGDEPERRSFVEIEDDSHLRAVIEACDAWRAVFHAASALKAVVPAEDTRIWGRFAASADVASKFVAGVAETLVRCLVAYCRKLRAAEEVSRTAGLVATAELCCGSTLKSLQRALRAVQAAVVETRGDSALPPDVRLRVSNLTDRAHGIAVDHAHNLLLRCEDAVSRLGAPFAKNDDLTWALSRTYRYLCTALLAPRVHEAAILWNGLFNDKGWDDARITKLNSDVHALFSKRQRQLTGGRAPPPALTPSPEADLPMAGGPTSVAPTSGAPTSGGPTNGPTSGPTSGLPPATTDTAGPTTSNKLRRRPDFETLFARHASSSGVASGLTATSPHDAGDDVIDMTDATPMVLN